MDDSVITQANILVDAVTCGNLVGIDEETWRRWSEAERTPAPVIKGHGCTRWRLAEILAWFDDRCPVRSSWDPKWKAKRRSG